MATSPPWCQEALMRLRTLTFEEAEQRLPLVRVILRPKLPKFKDFWCQRH